MYPSMPDDLTMSAVREYLDSRTDRSKPTTGKTMELLEITRKYNYFEFSDILNKQEGGTCMGKKHAKFEESQILPSKRFK
jgi:hypothetical protein